MYFPYFNILYLKHSRFKTPLTKYLTMTIPYLIGLNFTVQNKTDDLKCAGRSLLVCVPLFVVDKNLIFFNALH